MRGLVFTICALMFIGGASAAGGLAVPDNRTWGFTPARTHAQNLGITTNEAIYNMAICVKDAVVLARDIYAIIQAFQFQLVLSIISNVKEMLDVCESFKYLKLDARCGNAVKSARDNLRTNFPHYHDLISKDKIIKGFRDLVRDVDTIKNSCVRIEIYMEMKRALREGEMSLDF